MWKNLHQINQRPFVAIPNNLCLGMNIDWFNPYKDASYSVGAVYFVILNLPREERSKLENVILVSVILDQMSQKVLLIHFFRQLL